MGKIIFYEHRNFGGRHHECMSDCSDLRSYFSRCQSIRVESGMFMIYDRANYTGHQCFMRRGEYPEYMRMTSMSDCVRSCRVIPLHRGNFHMRLYDRFDMGGKMMELMDDCPNCTDRFHVSDFHSCNVMDGHWMLYEQPNYRGRMYYVRPGKYQRYSDWGGASPRVGSIRRIMDL